MREQTQNICDNCGKPVTGLYVLCRDCRDAIKKEREAKGPFVYTMLQVGGQFQEATWSNAEDGKRRAMQAYDETVATNDYSSCRVYQGAVMYDHKGFDIGKCTLLAEWVHPDRKTQL